MSLDLTPSPTGCSSGPTVGTGPQPLLDLRQTLAVVEQAFGISHVLSDENADIVAPYYRQSLPGYATLYNRWQCMHVALHEPHLDEEGAYFAQADAVGALLSGAPGQRVLELGCGLGANTLHLAAKHPQATFMGIDLMTTHVARATAKAGSLPNAGFRVASFEDLPYDIGTFDVIFAVETLCYARSPRHVAQGLARLLRPGGRIVIFDAHRRAGFDAASSDVVTAARLYEVATAVTRGFHPEGTWEAALSAAGLAVDGTNDITPRTSQGLTTLHRRSMKVFRDRKWRLALRMMPRYLARNVIAGLVGYHVCFGDGPEPDPMRGAVAYHKIVARKPGA
jgi:arsenite methyltransferase